MAGEQFDKALNANEAAYVMQQVAKADPQISLRLYNDLQNLTGQPQAQPGYTLDQVLQSQTPPALTPAAVDLIQDLQGYKYQDKTLIVHAVPEVTPQNVDTGIRDVTLPGANGTPQVVWRYTDTSVAQVAPIGAQQGDVPYQTTSIPGVPDSFANVPYYDQGFNNLNYAALNPGQYYGADGLGYDQGLIVIYQNSGYNGSYGQWMAQRSRQNQGTTYSGNTIGNGAIAQTGSTVGNGAIAQTGSTVGNGAIAQTGTNGTGTLSNPNRHSGLTIGNAAIGTTAVGTQAISTPATGTQAIASAHTARYSPTGQLINPTTEASTLPAHTARPIYSSTGQLINPTEASQAAQTARTRYSPTGQPIGQTTGEGSIAGTPTRTIVGPTGHVIGQIPYKPAQAAAPAASPYRTEPAATAGQTWHAPTERTPAATNTQGLPAWRQRQLNPAPTEAATPAPAARVVQHPTAAVAPPVEAAQRRQAYPNPGAGAGVVHTEARPANTAAQRPAAVVRKPGHP